MTSPRAPATSASSKNWRLWALAIASVVLVLALLAPTAVGRLIGELWVSTMTTVISLIGALFGG